MPRCRPPSRCYLPMVRAVFSTCQAEPWTRDSSTLAIGGVPIGWTLIRSAARHIDRHRGQTEPDGARRSVRGSLPGAPRPIRHTVAHLRCSEIPHAPLTIPGCRCRRCSRRRRDDRTSRRRVRRFRGRQTRRSHRAQRTLPPCRTAFTRGQLVRWRAATRRGVPARSGRRCLRTDDQFHGSLPCDRVPDTAAGGQVEGKSRHDRFQ